MIYHRYLLILHVRYIKQSHYIAFLIYHIRYISTYLPPAARLVLGTGTKASLRTTGNPISHLSLNGSTAFDEHPSPPAHVVIACL